MICPPHALVGLANAINALQETQPKLCIPQLVSDMCVQAMKASSSHVLLTEVGLFVSDSQLSFTDAQLTHMRDFLNSMPEVLAGPAVFWTSLGHQVVTEKTPKTIPVVSDVAVEDGDEIFTIGFPVFQAAQIQALDHVMQFRFDSQVSVVELEQLWDGAFIAASHTQDPLSLVPAVSWTFSSKPANSLLLVMTGGFLHVAKPNQQTLDWLASKGTFTDQFGLLLRPEVTADSLLSLVSPVFAPWKHSALDFLTAVQKCIVVPAMDQVSFSYKLDAHGPSHAVQRVLEFWTGVLARDYLVSCGFAFSVVSIPTGVTLCWSSLEAAVPIPIASFAQGLFHAACAKLFGAMNFQNGLRIAIKFIHGTMWKGLLPAKFEIGAILALLHSVYPGGYHFRILYKGKQMSDEFHLQDYISQSGPEVANLHLVLELSGGAPTGTKVAHRSQLSNKFASVLLEEGYELQWTSKAIDQMLSQLGTKEVAQAAEQLQGPNRVRVALQMLQEAKVDIPAIKPPKTKKGSFAKKSKIAQPHPAVYRAAPGTLLNVDGSDTPHVAQFGAQVSGYHLCSPSEAMPWLETSAPLSKDELALIVLGELQGSTQLPAAKIVLPCIDDQQRNVLIACHLVQFGE